MGGKRYYFIPKKGRRKSISSRWKVSGGDKGCGRPRRGKFYDRKASLKRKKFRVALERAKVSRDRHKVGGRKFGPCMRPQCWLGGSLRGTWLKEDYSSGKGYNRPKEKKSLRSACSLELPKRSG